MTALTTFLNTSLRFNITPLVQLLNDPFQVFLFRVLEHSDPVTLRRAFAGSQTLCLVMAVPSALLLFATARRHRAEDSKSALWAVLFDRSQSRFIRDRRPPRAGEAPRAVRALSPRQVQLLTVARLALVIGLGGLLLLNTTHLAHLYEVLRTKEFVRRYIIQIFLIPSVTLYCILFLSHVLSYFSDFLSLV